MRQIWKLNNWRSRPEIRDDRRAGLRCRIDREVDPQLRLACLDFCKWLRREYLFPVRVRVSIKRDRRIRAKDGERVCGTFWWPYDSCEEPYVRIAAGDFAELCRKWGEEEAVREILLCIAHELTHYYQWLNDLKLTERGEERQASMQSRLVVSAYLSQRQERAWADGFQNSPIMPFSGSIRMGSTSAFRTCRGVCPVLFPKIRPCRWRRKPCPCGCPGWSTASCRRPVRWISSPAGPMKAHTRSQFRFG